MVGIVRVESECAIFLSASGGRDVRFCRFEKNEGYFEVPAADVAARLRVTIGHDPAQTQPSASSEDRDEAGAGRGEATVVEQGIQTVDPAPPLPRIVRYKRSTVKMITRLPEPVAQSILRFGSHRKEGLFTLLSGANNVRTGLRQVLAGNRPTVPAIPAEAGEPPMPAPRSVVHPFARGDTYLSMGLDWDQKDLSCLYDVKKSAAIRVVLFCYDIIPVKYPHLCVGDVAAFFARYFADVAWCADKILCISECSRRDLTELLVQLGTPVPAMEVVHLGCSLKDEKPAGSDLADRVGDDFILFVSTIERRKNHITLYHAYARLCEEGVADLPKLVFVGMRGWGVEDLFADLQFDPRVAGRIVCLHDVTDAQLNDLYGRSRFTVFPSLYEGWGLAVGESLARGKFCLASNAASIPEAGQDFVEYLDPLDVPGWTERMRFFIRNGDELDLRAQRIREEYRPLGWPRAAEVIIQQALDRPLAS